ncbi:hypothetical protein B0J11DRAFT_508750 [Dendryphion nanum]|uniref:FHA domain-containing protein n=1 Tax=Dendryphion nanum TaxID=256645 RepID=A0A9P9DIQ2_9PLEO|nr:hypothetical protein B0J11DRAFT_508750 [Dendryphion nanum]
MTAVAPPPNFQNISRQGWTNNGPNGVNGAPMNDDYRMFMPRKNLQRANSSSSLASSASASTIVAAPAPQQTNGATPAPAAEAAAWARKKAPRGLWPPGKTEPVSGLSNARPQSIASAGPGPSATSAMTALNIPAPMVPSQHNGTSQSAQNGAPRPQVSDNPAILHLIPMNGTFERKTITVPFFPDVLRIGRQTNNKTIPTPLNGYFDSKVLSRQHAEIWADRNGKIWIRDVKSSNGTFVNGQRLSQENRDSDPHELREQDMLELGIDIVSEDQKTIVHHKVAARVEHAGIYSNAGTNIMDLNFGELENQQMGMIGSNGPQQLTNMRGRTPSQGSVNGGRLQGPPGAMQNNANLQRPAHPNFWLQPITMEQVVKKLNAEMKAARQQSQALQQTHNYISAILSSDPKKEAPKQPANNQTKLSPVKDLKTRFSEPPAPPPQQPLPEKPDAHQPSIRRTDTEKPKANGSPVRSDAQISTLAEALSSAKKEIEAQGLQLKNLETMLNEERRAREDAEERASRLERESAKDIDAASETTLVNGEVDEPEKALQLEQEAAENLESGSSSPTSAETATTRLQQRLELMVAEMTEMKQQMENYRLRAETAEEESATHRRTLTEMVEKIRADDAQTSNKTAKRRSRSDSDLARGLANGTVDDSGEDDSEEGEITIINEEDTVEDGTGALLRKVGLQNGHTITQDDAQTLSKISHELAVRNARQSNFATAHGAPAVSILTVVALGVAVMAWLNTYPKVER